MALRPCASAAVNPYNWFFGQLHSSSSASVPGTTLESTMGIVAANIYYPAQARTRSPALPCGWFCHCVRPHIPLSFRPPHAISPRRTFFSAWQDMEVEFLIGSRELARSFHAQGARNGGVTGRLAGIRPVRWALAVGRSSLIPHLPSHPIPSHPIPCLHIPSLPFHSSFAFQFYFWDRATERDLTSVSHLLDALKPGRSI
jgi:hypothetical protein